MKKRLAITAIALSLAALLAVGASLAYLFVETKSVKNTFTYGDIKIDLWESQLKADGTLDTSVKLSAKTADQAQSGYKMIPGNNIAKDPTVLVEAGSEACWLFVEIVESDNFDDFMTYAIADGWTALAGESNVYWRLVETTGTPYAVLRGNEIHVNEGVLKTALNALTNETMPTLTFTAYAVQKANVADAAAAWAIAENDGASVTTAVGG